MAPSSPARGQRRNSPFTKQQEAWVILQYGALSNCLAVRRKFRVHYKLSPFMVPRINAFRRLVSRVLESNGQVRPKAPAGRSPLTEELVQRVKDFLLPYTQNEQAVSLTTMATSLNISVTTAWRVVRKKLGWYPFKPRKVIPLTQAHKASRVTFCDWLLQHPEGFEDKVMWSDEKWFMLK